MKRINTLFYRSSRFSILCFIFLYAPSLFAFGLYLKLGPASLGNGGSNPLGIPPTAADIELSMVTESDWEFALGLPVTGVGKNYMLNDSLYVGLGGGIVIDANGVGPGVYSAFGYEFGGDTFQFIFEYKQTLAATSYGLISPYALRFGVGLWF